MHEREQETVESITSRGDRLRRVRPASGEGKLGVLLEGVEPEEPNHGTF